MGVRINMEENYVVRVGVTGNHIVVEAGSGQPHNDVELELPLSPAGIESAATLLTAVLQGLLARARK